MEEAVVVILVLLDLTVDLVLVEVLIQKSAISHSLLALRLTIMSVRQDFIAMVLEETHGSTARHSIAHQYLLKAVKLARMELLEVLRQMV